MAWNFASALADHDDVRAVAPIHRFDPRFWTVDFPRPMLAALVADGADRLRVDVAFTGRDNLAGIIWESQDRHDHPLVAYATRRDYRRTTLTFRWVSAGVKPLDAVHGPTLTIEGRDADGAPRSWFVRLWNYAVGSGEDAQITIPFDALREGFAPGGATVFAGDIDRMFLSIVPPDYDGTATSQYGAMVDAWVEWRDMICSGSGCVLPCGDAILPEHRLSIATAYDDSYHLSPQRLVRMVEHLGYAPPILHYVGMSHFPRLERVGGAWRASVSSGALATPALAWHAAFARELAARGWPVIFSLSFELFAEFCPADWAQRDASGGMALTGWVPPSTLLSPANGAAMGYLAHVLRALVAVQVAAGLPVKIQLGEPWWWVNPGRQLCAYDAATGAALGSLSVPIADLAGVQGAGACAMLDGLGNILAGASAALMAAVRDEAATLASGAAQTHILLYLPTILDAEMPDLRRANLPPAWAAPAFDVLQSEDYDWVTAGQKGRSAAGRAAISALNYPASARHHLVGFVRDAADKMQWREIADAAAASRAAGDAATFVWALPHVARDGFTYFETEGEGTMQAFADVDFPIAIGRDAMVEPHFSTAIVTSQSGFEQRIADWDGALLHFDAGAGVRSEGDVAALLNFYRARRGPAVGFRFRDPFDFASGPDASVTMADQYLGTGDGSRSDFPLRKAYGSGADVAWRRITRPVAGSILLSGDGVALTSGWTLAEGGVIRFAAPPAAGVILRAGFLFDVPVRFADDHLAVSRATFLAGEIAAVPLIEVREA
ncbi:MAG: DUF2460 domain-containing protein [Sphingomonadaceae bacterium]|nr:DUF2460 domain-containing protein [Sphingomonadaceae bacterium]